jgi:hypothetical protein
MMWSMHEEESQYGEGSILQRCCKGEPFCILQTQKHSRAVHNTLEHLSPVGRSA